jgi:hypothetical protein
MPEKRTEYKRLPGQKKNFLVGKYTLWLAADHVLHIYGRFGFEDYKRFYFADIQAITVQKTAGGWIQNLVFGILAAVFGIFFMWADGYGKIFPGIMTVALFLGMVLNWLRGPTCKTTLQTAVQTEALLSLHRLRTALRVMDRLKDLIHRVQGPLNAEVYGRLPASVRKTTPTPAARRNKQKADTDLRNEAGRAHLILYALLLFNGLLLVLHASLHDITITLIGMFVSMGIAIVTIIALIKQSGSNISRGLRILTWTTLGYICVTFFLGYIVGMAVAFENPAMAANQWELLKRWTAMSLLENPLIATLNIITLTGAFGLGIPGLLMLNHHLKSAKYSAESSRVSSGNSDAAGSREWKN